MIKELIKRCKVIAILRGIPDEKVIPYASALYKGGIRLVEVALNTPNAYGQIRDIIKNVPGLTVGAGTVININRAVRASEAGAQFMLSPSSDRDVLDYCSVNHINLLPGVMTPSDVSLCLSFGISTLKLFPAGDLPEEYIKSLKGPFDGTDYVAVGGIKPSNVKDWLSRGFIGVGIGSALAKKELLEKNLFDEITASVLEMTGSIL